VTDAPAGFVVTVDPGDRIHFLDWVGPAAHPGTDGVLLVPGLAATAWVWTPVARRLAERTPTIAMDLRGHGLSDAPTESDAYDPSAFAEDVVAVAEGSGLLDPAAAGSRVVLAGHGFGAIVAAWGAVALGPRCGGLVLVDGGWEALEEATGVDVDEFLRGLDEPPEVMASMRAFLRDRRGFDPSTWDADQEHAARMSVVETRAGRVVPTTRPHALEASVRTMFEYEPVATLSAVTAPIVALVASDDEAGTRHAALAAVSAARVANGNHAVRSMRFEATGHNLMRYRPADVTAAILSLAARAASPA
jgi:pimeloyl-ACP methyl ester carboxylesterase